MRIHVQLVGLFIMAAGCGAGEDKAALDTRGVAEPDATEVEKQVQPTLPITLYASSNGKKIASALEAYKAETGTRYRLLTDETPRDPNTVQDPTTLPNADIYLAGSFAELWAFAEADVFRPVRSSLIDSHIPQELRDPESRWVALAKRVRVIIYNKELVDVERLLNVVDYVSLGTESWTGDLCLSSSKIAGNQLLVSYLIANNGVRGAEIAVRNWRANFAAIPFQNDRGVAEAVAAGQCRIGIVDWNVALSVGAGQQESPLGAHHFKSSAENLIDVSGAGVSRHAHDPDGAVALLEWLTSATPNALYAAERREIPANPNAPKGVASTNMTQYMKSQSALSNLGYLQEDAIKLVERARYP